MTAIKIFQKECVESTAVILWGKVDFLDNFLLIGELLQVLIPVCNSAVFNVCRNSFHQRIPKLFGA
jgi:hypothetical protein